MSPALKNTALLLQHDLPLPTGRAKHRGSTPSDDQTFTTAAGGPPRPSAVVSSPQATAGGFRLKGAVNPNSLETTYHFEFGTTTSYGTNLPEPDANIGSGTSAVAVTQEVTGLLRTRLITTG